MSEADRAGNLAEYERVIYPIWKPIEQKWEATWQQGNCRPEIEVVHEIDWAIWNSGHRIQKDYKASPEEVRATAARNEKFARIAA